MKFMPLTAVTTLIASFSIAGVPLFNGFVSKWSIYIAAIQGSLKAGYLAVCAVIAILTSALTLASFIKFFGVSFLSRTSALVAAQAEKHGKLEVGWMMRIPKILLAAICITLGIVPSVAFKFMQNALDTSRQGLGLVLSNAAPMMGGPWVGMEDLNHTALFVPLLLLVVLGLAFLVTCAISKLGSASRRSAAPWLCGYVSEAECYRYSAHNFYAEIKRYFRWLGGMPRPRTGSQSSLKED